MPLHFPLTFSGYHANNISMILPIVPSKEQVLSELFPLTTVLYETFPEIAADTVVPYFSDREHVVDQRLATDMLRYEIKYILNSHGFDAEYDDDPMDQDAPSEVDLKRLPNNGIEGTYRGWRFKLLRSRNGCVPPPGRSERRKLYYAQQHYAQQLPLSGFEEPIRPPLLPNLVILWDFDSSYKRVTIRVAIPKESIGEFGIVSCYFNVPVPHPVEVTSQWASTLDNHFDDDDLREIEITWKEQDAVELEEHLGELQIPNIGA